MPDKKRPKVDSPAGGKDPKKVKSDKKDDEEKMDEQKSPNPRSRRKPAAPQWVNPEWEAGDTEAPARQEPINGVCVRNIAAFSEENSENIAEDETS